jgi:hypothetical protein
MCYAVRKYYNIRSCHVVCFTYVGMRLGLLKERRFRVYEIRMLRNIFGPKRNKVTAYSRKMRNELHIQVLKLYEIMKRRNEINLYRYNFCNLYEG